MIAAVAALEEHFAGHGELRAIEETLADWRRSPALSLSGFTAHSA